METQAQGLTNPLSSQDRAKKGSKSEPLKKPTSDSHPSTTKRDTHASSSKGKGASKEVMPLDSQGRLCFIYMSNHWYVESKKNKNIYASKMFQELNKTFPLLMHTEKH